jgi:hypothetical protein
MDIERPARVVGLSRHLVSDHQLLHGERFVPRVDDHQSNGVESDVGLEFLRLSRVFLTVVCIDQLLHGER